VTGVRQTDPHHGVSTTLVYLFLFALFAASLLGYFAGTRGG